MIRRRRGRCLSPALGGGRDLDAGGLLFSGALAIVDFAAGLALSVRSHFLWRFRLSAARADSPFLFWFRHGFGLLQTESSIVIARDFPVALELHQLHSQDFRYWRGRAQLIEKVSLGDGLCAPDHGD